MPVEREPTGVASVDRILGGGLERDGLTELYGEGGSGKTLFCLEVGRRVAIDDRWVLYIDTEGVSVERLETTSGASAEKVLRRFLLSAPKSLGEQTKAITTACELARSGKEPVGLLVLDSATYFYRLSLSQSDEDEARSSLILDLANLLSTSRELGIAALITNQVWRNLTTGELEPLGGSFVNHVAKTILRFEKERGAQRGVTLMKHRSRPEQSATFTITSTGLA